MTSTRRTEWIKIIVILTVAIVLLFFVAPGLQESPYNEF